MRIEIEGRLIEARAVTVTVTGASPDEVMESVRNLIRTKVGNESVIAIRNGQVQQNGSGRFECEVELRDGKCQGHRCTEEQAGDISAFNSGDLISAMCGANRIPRRGKL